MNEENNNNMNENILTNEEIKNINADDDMTLREQVELPKIEEVAPINETKVVENKPKKKKHPIKTLINIIIWLVVLSWAGVLVYDFLNVINEKDPKFCLEKSTEKNSDGVVEKCEGVGYNVYKYDYGTVKYIEFVPFFSKPKTLDELQK